MTMKQILSTLCVLRDVPASDSKDLEEGAAIDLDDAGHNIGLEILDVSEGE
jgi:uncharacterized protein YuzE